MTDNQFTGNAPTPQIALVGTTRAGKSVFITALAKYLEKKRDGTWLSPKQGKPRNTYVQIEEWWSVLRAGNWLPATPPGTLIELEWDLSVNGKKIPLRMFDYAGENLTDLFSGKKDDAAGAAKEFFDKVRTVFESASVLLVLINLESFIEKDIATAGENKATLVIAMSTFLEKLKRDGRSCRVCFVFTAYDQYKSVIQSKWGSVRNFLQQEIPPLFNEFVDEQSNVKVLPVAAVGETEARVDPHDGKTIRYPKPDFHTMGFEQLVKWLVEAVGDSKVESDARAAEDEQDEQNAKFVERLAREWNDISDAVQVASVERFLEAARLFPNPKRPIAPHLESQRLKYFNAANDLRSAILGRVRAERTESRRKLLKLTAGIVASIVAGVVGIFLIGAVKERYAEEDCTACAASGKISGDVTCSACQGRGSQSSYCQKCGGDGRIGERWDDGIWEQSCTDCSGNGRVASTCSTCSGKGTVAGTIACSMCNGKGKVPKYRAGK